ncbi:B3 domain-containing protein [Sesamum angolense]|uniref:B3 domain-containing protein n=1 Tax=Sesamum angolense TaxID=2727404 RepID=A0AAE1X4Q0_9LAMI|nr:B3 domain-containing protein [Sesamum angolense]
MAISQFSISNRSPVSSSKSKLKQKLAREFKTKLVKQRLMSLDNRHKDGESVINARPITCCPPKVETTSDHHSLDSVTTSAMERAKEVQANLSPHFPSFSKLMLRSHVSGGFWLGLPKFFCHGHLPKNDEIMVLVDENEEEYHAKYLVHKTGLSGGWRGFSVEHKLLEGDVVVFQLIEPLKFKVYIVRARRLVQVDGAITLLNLDFQTEPIDAVKMEDKLEENAGISQTAAEKYLELLAVDNRQKNDNGGSIPISQPAPDQSGDGGEIFGPEIVDGIRFAESLLSFKDVRCFEDFNIHVDGLVLDSELPMHLRTKYYELCRSQNIFLHEKVIPGLNSKLAAGMILETINIADAIRAANPNMGSNHIESWDKTLKAFEDLGMTVGFLRARIHKLVSLSRESQTVIELKRTERAAAEKEMRSLNEKLSNVKMLIGKLDSEIAALKVKNEELGFVFKEVAGAPW